MKKTQVRWTEEENRILTEFGGRKLVHELKELLPGRTALGIRYHRARLGVEMLPRYRSMVSAYTRSKLDEDRLCKLDQSLTIDDFDNDTIQILLGSVLGDGCITKKSGVQYRRNYQFCEHHGRKQADYVRWKAERLAAFLPTCSDRYPEMFTVSHPLFTVLRGKFYRVEGNKRKGLVPLDVLSRLDLLGLMVWYLDDGHLGMRRDGMRSDGRPAKPSPRITAKLFDHDGLVRLCGQLNNRFSLGLHVLRSKWKDSRCNVVHFRRDDFRRVIPVWRAHAERLELPDCMRYKLNMHDPRLRFIEDLDLRTKEAKSKLAQNALRPPCLT